jgi:putative MATE family efflux protein
MFDVSREEITDGSLPRVLVLLAAPLIAQNFALVAQSVVDLFWVGRLSADAGAAVGHATVLIAVVGIGPLRAFFSGCQIVTSQRAGADAVVAARRVPVNAAPAAVVAAGVLGSGLAVFAEDLVALLGTTGNVAELTEIYVTVYVVALVTTAASDTLESGFTGWGDTRAALWVNLIAIAVNLVLDPILIFRWWVVEPLGIAGAALATAIGYGCGALFALWLAWSGRREFYLTREALQIDVEAIREVLEVGTPVGLQSSGRQIARLIVVAIVTTVGGAPGLTAYYLGWQIATLAFVPPQGLSGAATSIVGQNLGADKPERARRVVWLGVAIALVGLSALGVVQWLLPEFFARLFVPGLSGDALAYSTEYLRVLAYGYPALGAIYTLEAGFNGASRTKVSMYSTLLQYWTVRLPIAAVGAFVLMAGMSAVFWAVTLSNIAAALGLGVYYWRSTSNGMLRKAAEEAGTTAAD